MSPIRFNLLGKYLTTEALETFGNFKRAGKVIRSLKHADDFVVVAEEVTVIHGMADTLTEIGNYNGTETNLGESKVRRI